ncbi:hypothetical protein [Conexibacter sp. CPCC 206217]|uniref:hypothetical protein n=1 Tax=Conexibacter sp. CPCC 206217 TaxID=3064574 RepID=UPI00272434CE|nr:hypothetical protein [Conexibacter sp. CPCC 206217]MDO8213034.1 hypothetical protein [Conexibacter sp. CPCC 206217]
MRLGAVYSDTVNALYRVVIPMMGLQGLGYEVVGVRLERGERLDISPLIGCDLVQLHRISFFDGHDPIADLHEAGALVSFDEDDDMGAGTPEIEAIVGSDRFASGQKQFANLLARLPEVDLVTTPSEALADRFEEAGAPTIEVIDNYLLDRFAGTNAIGHDGFVIGWHACAEHAIDAELLGLAAVLQQTMERHECVRVVTIGLDLGLDHERYRASPNVSFDMLTRELADVDLGIAPLADTPFGRARSNVKVREYAAAGVPWLASDLGPYAGLGKDQGGQLVGDDEWFAAIDQLVNSPRAHRKQRERARRWGTAETISSMCHIWEEAFLDTLATAQSV